MIQSNDVLVGGIDTVTAIEVMNDVSKYDKGLFLHCMRVGRLSKEVAKQLDLSIHEQMSMYYAGLLHDCGKVKVPKSILLKPTSLDSFERYVIEKHAIVSATVVKRFCTNEIILDAVEHHHERLNGNGYPKGIKDLSIYSCIIGVVDVFDALYYKRCYKAAICLSDSLKYLEDEADIQFSRKVVEALSEITKTRLFKKKSM